MYYLWHILILTDDTCLLWDNICLLLSIDRWQVSIISWHIYFEMTRVHCYLLWNDTCLLLDDTCLDSWHMPFVVNLQMTCVYWHDTCLLLSILRWYVSIFVYWEMTHVYCWYWQMTRVCCCLLTDDTWTVMVRNGSLQGEPTAVPSGGHAVIVLYGENGKSAVLSLKSANSARFEEYQTEQYQVKDS